MDIYAVNFNPTGGILNQRTKGNFVVSSTCKGKFIPKPTHMFKATAELLTDILKDCGLGITFASFCYIFQELNLSTIT